MLTGLAYVFTVLANIQYSNFERAHRYYGTARQHFQSLRNAMRRSADWPVVEHADERLVSRMEMLLHEAIAQTQLVLGNPREALSSVS